MMIAGRQTMMGGKPLVPVEWIQSDGSSYVVTDYDFTDITETIKLVAASTYTSNGYLNGIFTTGKGWGADSGFGFTALYADRQVCPSYGHKQFWNSTANNGNWSDGLFHTIEFSLPLASSNLNLTLDGTAITMGVRQSGTASLPTSDTNITLFARILNGAYSRINDRTKVSSLSFSKNGVMKANFVAARIGSQYGIYDTVRSKFFQSSGTLLHGADK